MEHSVISKQKSPVSPVTRSKGKQKAPQATCTKRRQEVIELSTKKKVKSSKK